MMNQNANTDISSITEPDAAQSSHLINVHKKQTPARCACGHKHTPQPQPAARRESRRQPWAPQPKKHRHMLQRSWEKGRLEEEAESAAAHPERLLMGRSQYEELKGKGHKQTKFKQRSDNYGNSNAGKRGGGEGSTSDAANLRQRPRSSFQTRP